MFERVCNIISLLNQAPLLESERIKATGADFFVNGGSSLIFFIVFNASESFGVEDGGVKDVGEAEKMHECYQYNRWEQKTRAKKSSIDGSVN